MGYIDFVVDRSIKELFICLYEQGFERNEIQRNVKKIQKIVKEVLYDNLYQISQNDSEMISHELKQLKKELRI